MDHSSGAGLYLDGHTGILTSSGNTFSHDAQGIRVAINTSFQHDDTSTFTGNGSDVYLNGGTISGEVSWYLNPAYAAAIHLSESITVAVGAVLRVLPGTVVKAAQYQILTVQGTLEARGEAAKPIVFTDWRDDAAGGDANGDGNQTVPSPGWWAGISVTGSGSADLEYCTLAYAGYSYHDAGLYKSGSGALTLKNTMLDHSDGAGLYLEGHTGVLTSSGNLFSNNARGVQVAINTSFQHDDTSTFTGNGSDVYLNGGTISGEVSWYLNPAYSMYLSGSITVSLGGVLRVLPGTVVKAAPYQILTVQGSLEARGQAAKRIVFTDWRDDDAGGDANGDGNTTGPSPGWWAGISVTDSGSADLEYCTIAYAGYSYHYAGLYKSGSGHLLLKRSTIRKAQGRGLLINNSSGNHVFERNTFIANTTGVYAVSQTEPFSLSGNLIEGNTEFGVRSQSSAEVDARNNWWGHPSGPQHAGLNPGGQGDKVSDGVQFSPWRTTPSTGEILSPLRSGTLVARDLLRFSGSVALEPDATYRWLFSDGRTFFGRVPEMISFPETGTVTVSYSATPEGDSDPYPDTRSFTVVADTGNLPDLRSTQISVAGTLAVGQPAQISYTVNNVGQGPAGPAWKDALYLSRDAHLDITDVFLGSVAVNRDLPAGQSYQNAVNITLPVLAEGAYNLILAVNDEWQILELHRLNNEYAAQITAQVPALKDSVTQTIPYAAGLVEQYFRLTAPAGRNLVLDLTGVPQGPEVFIRFGALPSRSEYDYRLPGGGRFVIPAAAAGEWYILVYGNMAQDGQYAMRFDMADVALTGSSPSRQGNGTDLSLRLTGAGFAHPLGVELLSGQGTAYGADDVEVDSFSQATAAFAAGTIPTGTYTIRVTRNGQTAQLPDALEIVTGGKPKLEVNLILPSRFGYHQLATVYVEYKNTGDAPMPAPLLMVTAVQKGRQAAILTLDQSRLSSGFWTSAMPEGFADSVQFIASGSAPGILQAGESRRMPVYYAGWQQPWDFSYPPFEWQVGVLDAEDATLVDWTALKSGMRPAYLSEDAWDVVWNNFTALSGRTWGDYVAMLSRNASYLHRHGQRIEEISALQAFSFRQAEGFSPAAALAGGVDAVIQAPGMPIVFERGYLHQISRRFTLGPLGRGWTHNWQFALRTSGDQTVIITDRTGTPRIFQPDSRYTGRYLAQAGDQGDLRIVTGGYLLKEQGGLVQFFSAEGRLIYVEDTNGNRITCTYSGDLLTDLTHSSGPALSIAYNGEGRIASVTDHRGRQTQYTYTGEHLTSVRGCDDLSTTFSYHPAAGPSKHSLTGIGLPDGNTRTFTYDDRGRLSSIYRNDEKEKVSLFHAGIGRVDVTDALGHTSRFFFDHWGRLFKTENAHGEAVEKTFDESGNLVGVTDPDGFRTTFAYDRQGNLVAATDPMHRVTRFTYTPALNRLASVTDAANNATAFGYDDRGNLKDKTYPGGHKESWQYDARGNPTSWTSRRGATTSFVYDSAGRITRRDFADGTSAVYRYDNRDNLEEAQDSQGTTTFTYNPHDYLTRVAYPGNRWLAFEYDDIGRRTFSEDQLGYRVAYHYDAAGRLCLLSNGASNIVAYTYDDSGRLARKSIGNGVYTTYRYDPVGRLLEMVNYRPDDSVLSSFAYAYDRRGRRTSMQTSYGLWRYSYDDAGQLTKAVLQSTDPDIPNQDLTYQYDVLGNRVRTMVNGQDQAYDTNSLNQYTRIGDRSYTYDLDGNLIREEGPDGVTVYTYNDHNRLTGITRGGDAWHYTYDALGNRVAVDENGAVIHYVHDPFALGNVVGEYDNAGNLTARYTHGIGLVSRAGTGGTDYYTFDPMGNASEISGPAGTLRNRYAYRPFGEAILSQQAVANPFRFMGELGVMAAPAGLTYVRARHYDAQVGRFTAMDPFGFLGGDVNLYRYAGNSPTDGSDPTGLWTPQSCARLRGATDMAGGVAWILLGSGKTVVGALGIASGVAAPAGAGLTVAGAASIAWGVLNMFHGAAAVMTGTNMPRFSEWWEFLLHQWGPRAGLSRSDIDTLASGKKVWDYLTLSSWLEILEQAIDEAGIADTYCPYNRMPVSEIGACPFLRSSQSSSRSPQDVGPSRQPLSSSACMPFKPIFSGDTGLAASHDPNQKLGPMGVLDRNFLRTSSPLSYQIDFENLKTATAPAQIVTIRDTLSPHLDPTTFELAQIGFGDTLVPVPSGLKSFDTLVDYAYKDGNYDFTIQVQIKAWLEDGVFSVNFISIDPATGLPPQDVGIGFLPPENETGRGQGFVSYMIKAKPDLPSGTEIRNIADIRFDFGRTIATNQVDPEDPSKGTDPDKEALITLDSTAPASRVAALPETVSRRVFTLSWSGEDDAQGAGVRTYEIYVSTNGGPYLLWLTTGETSAVFTGKCGDRYSFYSLAGDYVGNQQQQPLGPFATVEIQTAGGDADGSGQVDMADLIAVLQGQSRIASDHLDASICADVNGDGRLGMAEAIYILQVLSETRQEMNEK
ncbi:MAG: right-handed parallel beta-helix repeat-containing protein [Deltaproteobacteria bacterium]|nr:right-handed parallel beta-helix repeat-containing protein [Deltaproteobacteria bacterium]